MTCCARSQATEAGRAFIAEHIEPYQKAFGYKSMWAHEFSFTTWRENPAPIIEAVRGYLETDYDYPAELQAVADDLEAAKAEVFEGVPRPAARDELARALELSLRMNPLTPDHHFYIDQGTNARVRLVLIAIGRKLVAEQRARPTPRTSCTSSTTSCAASWPAASPSTRGARRRPPRRARRRLRGAPPRLGRHGDPGVRRLPVLVAVGVPGEAAPPAAGARGRDPRPAGLGRRGRGHGPGRALPPSSSARCSEGEIVVCRMTSPSWVVLFTKIAGLVTDAGGMASHPAVVSREFGIPAVVGTSDATRRIKTGDRVRVNGSTGRVEIVGDVRTTRQGLYTATRQPRPGDRRASDAPLVLPFTDPRCQEVELTGGKGASLATMTAEDLPVPPASSSPRRPSRPPSTPTPCGRP